MQYQRGSTQTKKINKPGVINEVIYSQFGSPDKTIQKLGRYGYGRSQDEL